jgi:hypothetical protein
MSQLRRIAPLDLPDLVKPDLGERPELVWVAPTDLWVDGTYQRDVNARTIKLLRRVVKQFSWNRMKPPIGARSYGRIHLIDGQHTAIAAATLGIDRIPVFVVAAEALQERARSFVAHNTDRVTVQPLAVYKALLAAGDPEAMVCQAVIEKAGVKFRTLNQVVETRLGDTGAFAAVQSLVKDQGPMRARIVLETLIKGECIPITAHQIRAANHLLWLNDPRITPETLGPVIALDGEEGVRSAQVRAKQMRTQVWRVLAERWTRRVHGKSQAAA